MFKYGLKPSPEPPSLRFGTYLVPKQLPPIPQAFGHYTVIPDSGWRMLANDTLGDCTVAGAMHCVMLWNAIAGINIVFTNADARDDYFAITGGADDGADMVQVAKYWQKTGFRDDQDSRHYIAAYMAVDHLNPDHYYAASYLFGAVGLGVQIPSSAQDQFSAGEPWANVPGDSIEGYHYVPLVGRKANGNAVVVTWGAAQEVEQSWLDANLQEVVAMISIEEMVNGTTPEGFNVAALEDDLAVIAG